MFKDIVSHDLAITSLPSGDDILAVACDGDDYLPAGLGGRTVGKLGVNFTMLELVAVQINVDDEILDALQVDMRIGNGEAVWCLDFPFA